MTIEFTDDELRMFRSIGAKAAFIKDIKANDYVFIPPVSRCTYGEDTPERIRKTQVQKLLVETVLHCDATYHDEDMKLVPHIVISFIGIDEEGLARHQSFGNTFPCFILSPETIAEQESKFDQELSDSALQLFAGAFNPDLNEKQTPDPEFNEE